MSQAGASKGGKMRLAVDGAGFYDLMVAVDNDAVFGDGKQAEMANFLIRLGYDAVAYNVSAAAPLAKQHRAQRGAEVRGDSPARSFSRSQWNGAC